MRAASLLRKQKVTPINEGKKHMEAVSSAGFEATGSGTHVLEPEYSKNEKSARVEEISSLDLEITDSTTHNV